MSTDLDPIPEPTPPSRAAEVLERLVRDRSGGPLRRRSSQLRQLGDSVRPSRVTSDDLAAEPVEPSASPRARWPVPGAVAVLAIVVAVTLVATLVVARRPPPIEERLPRADADRAPASGQQVDATAEDPVPPDDDGSARDPGVGGGAAGEQGAGEQGAGEQSTQLVVHVAGAVAAPGVVRLPQGSRVVDAVSAAGGLRPDAEPDRVNLAAPLTDGQRVVVPILGQPDPVELPGSASMPSPGAGGSAPAGAGATGALGQPVDLNTATVEQLDTLPGIGPATANAILDHRTSEGPFRSVDELIEVRGIGEAKLEALRDLVTVGGAP